MLTLIVLFLEKSLGSKLKNVFLDSLELFCLFKPELKSHRVDSILGINNYACLNKIDEELESVTAGDLEERLAKIYLLNCLQGNRRVRGNIILDEGKLSALRPLLYGVSCSKEDC